MDHGRGHLEPPHLGRGRERRVAGTSDLTVHRLAGFIHLPIGGGADTLELVSPDYTSTLPDRVGERISR